MAFVIWAVKKDNKDDKKVKLTSQELDFNEAFERIYEHVVEHRIRFIQGITGEERRETLRRAFSKATKTTPEIEKNTVGRGKKGLISLMTKLINRLAQFKDEIFENFDNLLKKIRQFWYHLKKAFFKTWRELFTLKVFGWSIVILFVVVWSYFAIMSIKQRTSTWFEAGYSALVCIGIYLIFAFLFLVVNLISSFKDFPHSPKS